MSDLSVNAVGGASACRTCASLRRAKRYSRVCDEIMVLLENDAFLTELTRLFQKCRTSGSVVVTLKKYDGRTKPVPRKGHSESFEPADNKCLVRASDGKKKISTVVSTKEVIKFQMAYSNLLRAHIDGLKKKDKKSKSKKTKATQ
ncbi:signal recognition particle 14 kDa protein [Austrofundulus limnaeus]|uniref:Signal recognition particle 14 kDa protein n=1 Tax=Austrofundulus limnaeus TaxID=52670 RepID=A0A2I4BHU0_AUSLI|nr:PREDICTED: signal recognition particle 14 kDa protein [Austrofundulus limnaeus]